MTGKRISFALAVASLLFVGAGCDQQATIDTSASINASQPEYMDVNDSGNVNAGANADDDADMKAGANTNANIKVTVPTSIDESIDAIIDDGGAEIRANQDMEMDAADVDSDKASAKAYGTASYDIETK